MGLSTSFHDIPVLDFYLFYLTYGKEGYPLTIYIGDNWQEYCTVKDQNEFEEKLLSLIDNRMKKHLLSTAGQMVTCRKCWNKK